MRFNGLRAGISAGSDDAVKSFRRTLGKMTKSNKFLLTGAAVAGLLAGTSATIKASGFSGEGFGHQRKTIPRPTRRQKKSTPVKARTAARVRAAARLATTAARARTPARARAAARPTAARCPSNSLNGNVQLTIARLCGGRCKRAGPRSPLIVCMSPRNCAPGELAMPANRFNGFTDYGIGIGLRSPHYDHILERKPVVRLVRNHL